MAERRTVKPRKKKPSGPAGRGEPTVRKVTIEVIDPPPPSPLRGLLPTSQEVEDIVERECKQRPMSPAARLRVTEDLKMQYYFGGYSIVYRDTPQGKEVLAVGDGRDHPPLPRGRPTPNTRVPFSGHAGLMVTDRMLRIPLQYYKAPGITETLVRPVLRLSVQVGPGASRSPRSLRFGYPVDDNPGGENRRKCRTRHPTEKHGV